MRETMRLIRFILLILVAAAPSSVSAQSMNFEQAAAMLGASCGTDIDNVCRGVSLDPIRLKDCLRRNDDSISPACRGDSQRAFSAIEQRVSARATLAKLCNWEMNHLCGEVRQDPAKGLQCLLDATKRVTPNCTKAINAAGYR